MMSGNYVVELDEILFTAAGSLFVIELGDTLRFSLHPCHAPLVAGQTVPPASITRDGLQELVPFEIICGIAYISVHASVPGPHDVSISVPCEIDGITASTSATFTVLVQPTLQGAVSRSLKHMLLHTQITRLLGVLDTWSAAFEAVAAGGYNSVYLTPVQLLSASSGSAFCVANQLQLGLSLFGGSDPASSLAGFDELRSVVDSCSEKFNLTFVTDIVLNHMAFDSPFLFQHPESTYNINNSPHLRAAALLDAALHSFSHRVLDAEFISSGLVPVVKGTSAVLNLDTELEISKFVEVFFHQVI
jgi:hypothetical protein